MVETKEEMKKRGKLSRQRGGIFETKVREDLKKMGWIIDKWMNTVDFEKNELAPAKRKYNPFRKVLSIGTGFPDFICFKREGELFDVIAVEVKMNGLLDKKEIGMCLWLIENKIFSRILIAKKTKVKNKIVIEYVDVKEKYGKKI